MQAEDQVAELKAIVLDQQDQITALENESII